MSDDKELDEMMRKMRAHLRASPSRGNIRGIDPDNPSEIMRHERESKAFDNERLALRACLIINVADRVA